MIHWGRTTQKNPWIFKQNKTTICVPGFLCGTSGLGDALGLEGTRRLSFGPVEMSKVLNLQLRMMILGPVKMCKFLNTLLRVMIQHISFDFSDEPEDSFSAKKFFRDYFCHLRIIPQTSPVGAISTMPV